METIEKLIKEYGQLIKERDLAKMELQTYQEIYRKMAESMGLDPTRLLKMKVVSCETQKQQWSGKQITYVAFEESIQNFE